MKIGYDAESAFHNTEEMGNFCRTFLSGMLKLHPENEYQLFSTGKELELPYFIRSLNESKAPWKMTKIGFLGKVASIFGWGSKVSSKNTDIYHGLSNELPVDWKQTKVKSIVTFHDLNFIRFQEEYRAIDKWAFDKKYSFATKNADLIIATSTQTKLDLEEFYPASIGKIKVIYQDTDFAFHYRKRTEAVAKILYKFDIVERPYILCVNRLDKRKNLKILVEAFKKIFQQIPEDLVLVGERGDAADEILDQLSSFDGRLRWLGKVETDDLVNLYDGCSFTVNPSVFDGFSIPLLESMRRGKAIVASKIFCFEEIAGTAAIYAEPGSSDDFASQLFELSSNTSLRKQLEIASQTECKKFDPTKLTEKIHELYVVLR